MKSEVFNSWACYLHKYNRQNVSRVESSMQLDKAGLILAHHMQR